MHWRWPRAGADVRSATCWRGGGAHPAGVGGAGGEGSVRQGGCDPAGSNRWVIADVEEKLGPVRILVNNAARPSEGCALADLDEAVWQQILETNLSSVFYFS